VGGQRPAADAGAAPTHQLFIVIVGVGLAAGGLATLGEVFPVFLAFATPLLFGTLAAIVTSFSQEAAVLGPLVGVYILVLMKTSVVHKRSLENALELSLANAALAARLDVASQKAQAASRAKSEFLARMSHEIRTPMNGVLGTTELLCDAALPEREHHLAVLAHSSSEQLLALLNDVLDMARIEAGRIDIHDAPTSIESVLEDLGAMLSVQADQKGLTLVCHADADVPSAVLADATRLRQVLTNLTGNAIKFTDAGEVEVRASVERSERERELVIRVRDTGAGIPPEHHEAIFTAFEQVRQRSVVIRGTGLGLAISSRLVRLMGGSIAIESAVGRGSCFSVRLPCRAVEPSAHEEPALNGSRIALCVERPLERRVIAEWLSRAGAEVTTLPTPDAIASTAADLVVLDPGAVTGDALVALLGATNRALILERPSSRFETRRWSDHAHRPLPLPLQRGRLLTAVSALETRTSASAVANEAVAPTGADGVRVLVVDDDAVNRMVAGHMLSRLGVASDAVEDGEETLVALRAGRYDLVLLDFELPGIDGDEVTRRLRAMDVRARSGSRLPIVALTAHVLPQHHERCHAAGMDAVLTKPLTTDALRAELARFDLLESPRIHHIDQ